jgi:galactoside O-acetyltransferase
MAFLSREKLEDFNFKHLGENVLISDKASFHNAGNISIGNNSRIDDFCVLSAGTGGIQIGSNVHIAVYTSLIGKGKITIDDYANLSSKIAVYSSNDDYSGNYMTNPTIPERFTNVQHGEVYIGKHVIIGSGTIILPDLRIETGACIGSLTLIKEDCKSFGIYAGVPAKFIKERSKNLLKIEEEFKKHINSGK